MVFCIERDCLIFLKNLVFQWKTLDVDRNTRFLESETLEILGFSHLEFEVLGISLKIPSISTPSISKKKESEILGCYWILCICMSYSIGFCFTYVYIDY